MCLKKRCRRVRIKDMPTNPVNLENLQEVPAEYRITLSGDNFLIYDWFNDPNPGRSRVIVFRTNENIRILYHSSVWFCVILLANFFAL